MPGGSLFWEVADPCADSTCSQTMYCVDNLSDPVSWYYLFETLGKHNNNNNKYEEKPNKKLRKRGCGGEI